jgi:hypothetical protein
MPQHRWFDDVHTSQQVLINNVHSLLLGASTVAYVSDRLPGVRMCKTVTAVHHQLDVSCTAACKLMMLEQQPDMVIQVCVQANSYCLLVHPRHG